MPSEGDRPALCTIRDTILLAVSFVGDLDEACFAKDRKTVFAVVRCLEIVSEASRRLGDDLISRWPQIPWAQIAGAGNIYRHEYDNVLESYVWATVRYSLPPLLNVAVSELGD
ncbi:MAG TPA: HepT-like ribonuclease domain-containing protein [Caulobacteraceae bacterium]|jgi:uncharacterized protein with HEPN domain|nr:HepT-like ribonuclease domain-containing protein [Caulobacteraceae bacterium]